MKRSLPASMAASVSKLRGAVRQKKSRLLNFLSNARSRHPFDPQIQASYQQAHLNLRSKELGHLPPHTPKLKLPQAVVPPPVTS
jgi:hypothetical protein